jgi:hypothetical protein
MEKAYAEQFGEFHAHEPGQKGFKGIGNGGQPADVMERMTGWSAKTESFKDVPFEDFKARHDAGAIQTLATKTGTGFDGWWRDNMSGQMFGTAPVSHHAYGITDAYYAPDGTPMVTLSNPWNTWMPFGKWGTEPSIPYSEAQAHFGDNAWAAPSSYWRTRTSGGGGP